MLKRTIISAFLLVLSTAAIAADKTGFDAAYTAADAARKKAASVEYEWNTTAPLLKKAQAAAATGDYAKAIKLATEAKKQGEIAYAQSQHEAKNWRDSVVK